MLRDASQASERDHSGVQEEFDHNGWRDKRDAAFRKVKLSPERARGARLLAKVALISSAEKVKNSAQALCDALGVSLDGFVEIADDQAAEPEDRDRRWDEQALSNASALDAAFESLVDAFKAEYNEQLKSRS